MRTVYQKKLRSAKSWNSAGEQVCNISLDVQ